MPALTNGYITFGCFQNFSKINDEVLTVWGRILQKLKNARLKIQTWPLHSSTIRQEFLKSLSQHGITPERVILEGHLPRAEYFEELSRIDIILDTFPFTGGTTTCEALWMGVPTVTLAGKTMVARQGASLLSCLGMSDWIGENVEEYETKAIEHSTDPEKLARIRKGLRQKMFASPLCDSSHFAQNFVKAMWGMWQKYQSEE